MSPVIVASAIVLTVGLTRMDTGTSGGTEIAADTRITRTVGAVVGTGATARASLTASTPAKAASVDARPADALLCASYSSIHAKMLAPHKASGDIWAANRYRLALSQYADANADIRAAITADVEALEVQIAAFPEPQPYEQPPVWHVEEPPAIVARINQACRPTAR
ncbi:hypothetical protein [Mycobacterium sp. JS623]|uniref:hypothetical protein n=1 Tax=Mycobacterium sp. JS623 TaxID=212767 RepID=UPI0012F960BA|nr:hypothetical protein [Mycobacterium sp. JS623]